MLTGKEDLRKAIVEAFAMEKGLRDFYDYAKDRSETAEVQDLFGRLREWETTHMDYLAFLYRALEGDLDLKPFDEFAKSLKPGHMESGVPVAEAEVLFRPEECTTEKAALDIALRIEGKAYNMYRRFSEGAQDSNARVVFKDMMEQEQKHIDTLKKGRI